MIPLKEQIKALNVSIKGIDHGLADEKMFPPVRKELVRRKQCLEDTIQTLKILEPLILAYENIESKAKP